MNILDLIIKLVNNPYELDNKIRPFFNEKDEFYILIKDYSNKYRENKGINLSLEIPNKIEQLYKTDTKVNNFFNNLK